MERISLKSLLQDRIRELKTQLRSRADTKQERDLSSRVRESDPLIREAGVGYMRKSPVSWVTFLLSSPQALPNRSLFYHFRILLSCSLELLLNWFNLVLLVGSGDR